MHFTSAALALLLTMALTLPTARAAGFGAAPGSVTLGSNLSITVPLQVDDGEAAEPDCVSAEVHVGERRISPASVRVAVEPGATARDRWVRVSTTVSIDEPLLTLQMSAGCSTRLVRRYTLFADPPAVPAAAPVAPELAPAGSMTAGSPASPSAAPSTAAASLMASPAAARAVPARSKATAARPQTVASARPQREATGPRSRRARAQALAAAPRAAVPKPRLTLSPPEPAQAVGAASVATAAAAAQPSAEAASAVESALQAVNSASAALMASSASAAAADAAASAATQRALALEAQVGRLIAESKLQREDNLQLRSRLASVQTGGGWIPWLGGLLALLALAVLWLIWKLRRVQQQAQAHWWKVSQLDAKAEAAPEESQPAPSELMVAPVPVRQPAPVAPIDPVLVAARLAMDAAAAGAAAPVRVAATAPGQRLTTTHATTQADPLSAEVGWTTVTPPRPVSAEELIDLEQQAEFFIVLGQDEAAIDLLVSHIRTTGGISPLPYLKLLEIYRRRGEAESYARTRTRFNQRFNAYAPDWEADLQGGRLLQAYPEVMAALQRAWGQPVAAMTALEALLFRKDGGQMFDLPAYREVLLLYSLARDMLEHPGTTASPMDLHLPLNERTAALAVRRGGGHRMDDTQPLRPEAFVDRPPTQAALDLDLSQLGELNTGVTRPAAFTELDIGLDSQFADLRQPGAAAQRPPPRGGGRS